MPPPVFIGNAALIDPVSMYAPVRLVAWHEMRSLPLPGAGGRMAGAAEQPGDDLRPRCAEVEAGRQAARGADALGPVGYITTYSSASASMSASVRSGSASDGAAADGGGAGSGRTISLNQ